MQQRVETLHGMIGRVSRWLKPGKVPAGSELAHVDPVALVTPPEGLEVRNRLFFAPFNHSVALVNPPNIRQDRLGTNTSKTPTKRRGRFLAARLRSDRHVGEPTQAAWLHGGVVAVAIVVRARRSALGVSTVE
jgi:hypothetical protein